MLSIALYLLSHAMLLSLHLSGGSFPRPLSAQEEKKYVEQMLAGDLEAGVPIAEGLRRFQEWAGPDAEFAEWGLDAVSLYTSPSPRD